MYIGTCMYSYIYQIQSAEVNQINIVFTAYLLLNVLLVSIISNN